MYMWTVLPTYYNIGIWYRHFNDSRYMTIHDFFPQISTRIMCQLSCCFLPMGLSFIHRLRRHIDGRILKLAPQTLHPLPRNQYPFRSLSGHSLLSRYLLQNTRRWGQVVVGSSWNSQRGDRPVAKAALRKFVKIANFSIFFPGEISFSRHKRHFFLIYSYPPFQQFILSRWCGD